MKNFLVLFFLCFTLFQCKVPDKRVLSDSYAWDTLVLAPVEVKDLVLAREVCWTTSFDFCHDYFDHSYRLAPIFVHLNTKDVLASYDSVVYQPVSYGHWAEVLKANEIKFMDSWEIEDSLKISKDNMIGFYDKVLRRKVNKRYHSFGFKDANFSGWLFYSLHRVRFTCMYTGIRPVQIVFTGKKDKNKLSMTKMCKVYTILNILSVEPVSKEEFLKSNGLPFNEKVSYKEQKVDSKGGTH